MHIAIKERCTTQIVIAGIPLISNIPDKKNFNHSGLYPAIAQAG